MSPVGGINQTLVNLRTRPVGYDNVPFNSSKSNNFRLTIGGNLISFSLLPAGEKRPNNFVNTYRKKNEPEEQANSAKVAAYLNIDGNDKVVKLCLFIDLLKLTHILAEDDEVKAIFNTLGELKSFSIKKDGKREFVPYKSKAAITALKKMAEGKKNRVNHNEFTALSELLKSPKMTNEEKMNVLQIIGEADKDIKKTSYPTARRLYAIAKGLSMIENFAVREQVQKIIQEALKGVHDVVQKMIQQWDEDRRKDMENLKRFLKKQIQKKIDEINSQKSVAKDALDRILATNDIREIRTFLSKLSPELASEIVLPTRFLQDLELREEFMATVELRKALDQLKDNFSGTLSLSIDLNSVNATVFELAIMELPGFKKMVNEGMDGMVISFNGNRSNKQRNFIEEMMFV